MDSKEKKLYRSTKKWRDFRQQRLKDVNNTCQMCKIKKKKNLHLHHINEDAYGDEKPADVVVLCALCHKELERLLKRKEFDIGIYLVQLKHYYDITKS